MKDKFFPAKVQRTIAHTISHLISMLTCNTGLPAQTIWSKSLDVVKALKVLLGELDDETSFFYVKSIKCQMPVVKITFIVIDPVHNTDMTEENYDYEQKIARISIHREHDITVEFTRKGNILLWHGDNKLFKAKTARDITNLSLVDQVVYMATKNIN